MNELARLLRIIFQVGLNLDMIKAERINDTAINIDFSDTFHFIITNEEWSLITKAINMNEKDFETWIQQ